MDQQEQALFEARQAEKKELGLETQSVEEKQEKTEQEKEPEQKEEETEVEEAPQPEEDESEEDEESEEEESEDEDTETTRNSSRDIKEMKRSFKAEIKALKDELATAKTPKEKTEIITDFEAYRNEKAKKLGLNADVLKELNDIQDKYFENKYGEKLKKIDAFDSLLEKSTKEDQAKQDQQIFTNEWTKTEPEFKKQFPNATQEQIETAKKEMDALAHSKEYHKYPMDYIMFKEKARFEKVLFSPNKKTFESGRASREVGTQEYEGVPKNLSSMSASEFEAIERSRNEHLNTYGREPMKLRTQDESGRIVERLV